MEDINIGYGNKIKELSVKYNVTIKQIAKDTGISVNSLYSIVKRNSNKIDIRILIKLSKYFNISI